MEMFKEFNPLAPTSQQGGNSQDPRNLATPAYQETPKRGIDIPNNQDSHNPSSSKESAVDVMDEVWNTDPSKLPKEPSWSPIEAEKFTEASKSFQASFTEEELEEAQNDPRKMQELLNKAAQQGLAASANMSSKVTADYIRQEREASEARFKRNLTMSSVMSEVRNLNPALTSGPFKGLTEDLVGKYMSVNPDVSPVEAAKLVDKYVSEKLGLSKVPTSNEGEKENTTDDKDTQNWVEFSKVVS